MNAMCEQIQQKILDSPHAELSREEQRHLHLCAACSEAVENAQAVGTGLMLIARQTDVRAPIRPRSELTSRVRSRLSQPTGPDFSRETERPPRRAAVRLAARLASASGLRRGLGWAAAAALLAAVVVFGASKAAKERPIGALEFAVGPVAVHETSGVREHQGLGHWTYRRASTLQLPEQALGVFSLGDDVRGALASETTVAMVGPNEIEVARGAVWLRVLPQRREFLVRSPHGLVRVTGTSFGVTVTEQETRVDVATGSVRVSQAGRQIEVAAEHALRLRADGFETPSARPEADRLPEWVEALLAKEKAAHAGQYVPSLRE